MLKWSLLSSVLTSTDFRKHLLIFSVPSTISLSSQYKDWEADPALWSSQQSSLWEKQIILKHSDICIILKALRDERRAGVSGLPRVTQCVANRDLGYFDPESYVLPTAPSYGLRVSVFLDLHFYEKRTTVSLMTVYTILFFLPQCPRARVGKLWPSASNPFDDGEH